MTEEVPRGWRKLYNGPVKIRNPPGLILLWLSNMDGWACAMNEKDEKSIHKRSRKAGSQYIPLGDIGVVSFTNLKKKNSVRR
jgi:hypothetical protein